MVRETFACALVNGSRVLRCPLREGGAVGGEVQLGPEDVAVTGEGADLHVVFYSPGVVPVEGRQWEGELILDGGRAAIPLGAIKTRREKREVRRSVPFVPLTAAVRILAVAGGASPGPAMSEEESELLDRVVGAMEDPEVNPRSGSLPVGEVRAAVAGLATGIPNNDFIKRAYGGDIEAFLRAHPQTFTLFRYTGSEIKGRGMGGFVNPWDTRVVLKKGKRVQFCEAEEEHEALAFMQGVLRDGDLTSDELLSALHAEGKGLAISPAFSQLMRFLGRNKHIFSWSTDPGQVTVVGLASAPPAAKQRQQRTEKERHHRHQHPALTQDWQEPAVIRPCT